MTHPICPPDCQHRTVYCHATCRRYLEARTTKLLQYRQNVARSARISFEQDVKKRIARQHHKKQKERTS